MFLIRFYVAKNSNLTTYTTRIYYNLNKVTGADTISIILLHSQVSEWNEIYIEGKEKRQIICK